MHLFKLSVVITCGLTAVFQCALCIVEAADEDGLTIELSTGPILGRLEPSKSTPGSSVRVFRGIPYAEPPLGELRFKAPVPIAKWKETKDLTNFQIVDCIQTVPTWINISGVLSEDCLTLNVYTPQNVNLSQPLPVMFWIYGGGFIVGTTDPGFQGADFLLDQGVVFVSVNYRVSALGFLNLGTADAPGNAGLKDQLLGLKWVQNEISKFGGDPKRVTLFGESAGSASVIYHYLSPKSLGLFHRAMAQSGNALVDWAFLESGFIERGRVLSDLLNCTKNDTIDIKCLQTADVSLYKKYQRIPLPNEALVRGSTFEFVPSIEIASDSAFLTDTPINLLKNKNGSKVPLIMGVNHDDGLMEIRVNSSFYEDLPKQLSYFISKSIRDKKSSTELTANAASINLEYLNNTVPSAGNYVGFIKLYTDTMFAVSTGQFAKEVASQGNVYLYHFDFAGSFRITNTIAYKMNVTGVSHGEQKRYFFTQSDINQIEGPATEKAVLEKMVKLLTNFAKTGNPTPTDDLVNVTSVLEKFQWTPVNANATNYLIITDKLEMSQDNFHERSIDFWEAINKVSSESSPRLSFSFLVVLMSLVAKFVFN